MKNDFSKSFDENRAYRQGYALGRAGASRSQWEPQKLLLPKRLQPVFELGRIDGFIDAAREAKK